MPTRVDAALSRLLVRDPLVRVVYTVAVTEDSFLESLAPMGASVFVHPAHRDFVDSLRLGNGAQEHPPLAVLEKAG